MLTSLGLVVTSLILTALMTGLWIKIAKAKQIYDPPERRRLHPETIPRGGGIGIAVLMISLSVVVAYRTSTSFSYWPLIAAAIGIYALLGFFDDLKPMASNTKLFFHLLAAGIISIIAASGQVSGLIVMVTIALAYFFFVNAWNFMDGSNGMVAMQSFVISLSFVLLSDLEGDMRIYALVLVAACLGFLPFNFPNAKVFLGDVGSHTLGACVVGLAVIAVVQSVWTLLEIACLFSAVWIDVLLTLIRRAMRGFKLTQAHRSHLYQYAIRAGRSHASVCIYYAAWTVFTMLAVAVSRHASEAVAKLILLAVLGLGCILHQCLRLYVLKSGKI